jgi:hypothetical protein
LRQLYVLLLSGKVEGCSFHAFENATGLRLTDQDGSLREDLPPTTTFLNRLLTLTIDLLCEGSNPHLSAPEQHHAGDPPEGR